MPVLALIPFIFTNVYIAFAMNAVIAFAFYMGIAYLGGVLFGQDAPESDAAATPDSQSRSWDPHTTQQEGIACPRAWGKNLHHGNIVVKWTAVADDREILYLIVEHGDGPTKGIVVDDGVKQVFLNDQPITNFTDVEVQERLGTFNQDCMTGFEKHKNEHMVTNKLLKDEPIIFTTPNDNFDDLEYTISWPNGLRKYHKSGGMDYSWCVVQVRIREHGSGEEGWEVLFDDGVSVRQVEPLFRAYNVSELLAAAELDPLERGKQYDLEFTNLTGPSERHVNDVYARSVREVIDVAFTRPGKALVGIRAVATAQLHGRLDVKVIREDRLIHVFNGTSWEIKYSRNRAWVTWDALTQPVISGDGNSGGDFTIEHYEGFSPAYLDLDFFYKWAEFCSTQIPSGYPAPDNLEDRIACDTILDFHMSVWKFVQELANIGRAHLYWSDTLTGWIDDEVTTVSGLVTMDNIMARSWKNAWSEKSKLAGKVEVFFQDSRQGYERTPATLPNESAGKYTNIVSLEGVGITTRGTAIHLANHALKRNELIRNINNFRQYKDGFRYKPGDVINIQHKVPNWGEGHRAVKSTAANKITLDRTCAAIPTDLLFIQVFNTATKKVEVKSYTVQSVAGKVVTITTNWDITPKKNYMVAIGADGDIQTRRITKMDLRVDNYFDISVETYDPALFTADDLVPDLPDQNYIWSQPANPLTRPVTRAEVVEIIHQVMVPQPDIDAPFTSNCTWTGSGGDTVSWSKTDATEPIIFRYKGTSYEITPDGTTDAFIYWDPNFTTTFRHTNDAAVAVALGKWYMCRNVAGVAWPTVPFSSVHAGVLQAGTITAALGQIANLTVGTLQIQDDAVTLGVSAYTDGSGGTGDVQTLEITTTGQPVNIIGTLKVSGGPIGGMARTYRVKLYRDANLIYDSGDLLMVCFLTEITAHIMCTIAFRETPAADTYTYKLNFTGSCASSKRFLYAQEVKK